MRIEKTVAVNAPREVVWPFLWDVERVAGCIRGTSDVRTIEPGRRYAASVTQRVGPFGVTVPLAIEVTDVQAPRSLAIDAGGRDARLGSRLRVAMRLDLDEDPGDPGRTVLRIDSTISLQGKLATLGQSVVSRKADEELEAFATALGAALDEGPTR